MEQFKEIIAVTSYAIETVGVLVMIIGFIIATVKFIRGFVSASNGELYQKYRREIARSIVLGLDFLIAGDIIQTIIVSDTLSSVGILSLIIIMRTFIAFTINLEIEGRWPWQEARERKKGEKTA